jgi:hypothetical protein
MIMMPASLLACHGISVHWQLEAVKVFRSFGRLRTVKPLRRRRRPVEFIGSSEMASATRDVGQLLAKALDLEGHFAVDAERCVNRRRCFQTDGLGALHFIPPSPPRPRLPLSSFARPPPSIPLPCAAPPFSATKYKALCTDAEKSLKKALEANKRVKGLAEIERGMSELIRGGQLKVDDDNFKELQGSLRKSRESLDVVHSVQPTTGSLFVRLFLGKVNVREGSSDDREILRSEYEKFRFRTSFGFIVLPIVWVLNYTFLRHTWRYTHWIHILTHVWLLYYYTSLALRVNILRVVRFFGAGHAAAF